MFATPKTTATEHADELGKHDIVGELAIFSPVEYDPEAPTRYGTSPSLIARVHVVTGPHTGRVEDHFYAAGNLARQIGEALEVGTMAPGRIRTGTSANGRSWFGIEWATDAGDLELAEAAIRPPSLAKQTADAVAHLKAKTKTTPTDDVVPF